MQDKVSSLAGVDSGGLREMRASGGNSVRFLDLKWRLSHVDRPVIIVDAMSEYHGYIKGIPTSFLAYHKQASYKHLLRRLILTGSINVHPELVTSEEEEVIKHGFAYKKVDIGSSFVSNDEDVDKIIAFYDSVSPDAWLHFHCSHGKGRTTLLLVMLDIMKNAPRVSIGDIVKRQHLLGSENLFNTEVWKNGTYNKAMLVQRKNFVEKFYKFICQRKAGGIQVWSKWHPLNK